MEASLRLNHYRSTQLRTEPRLTWWSKPALLCPLVVDGELAPRCISGPCIITYLKQEHSLRGVIQTDPKSGWELGHNYFFFFNYCYLLTLPRTWIWPDQKNERPRRLRTSCWSPRESAFPSQAQAHGGPLRHTEAAREHAVNCDRRKIQWGGRYTPQCADCGARVPS